MEDIPQAMNTKEDQKVIAAMKRYGGGFVKSLAECFQRADADNYRRLRLAFPEIWEQYSKMAGND
jgi:hypothetical protein